MSRACRARTVTEDGLSHDCTSSLIRPGEQTGLPLCYHHDKLAAGITTPAPSGYANERVVRMVLMVLGAEVVLWFERVENDEQSASNDELADAS